MIPCHHLTKSNMTYSQHFKRAGSFAVSCMLMSVVCGIHAVLPWFFTETFSDFVIKLARKFNEERVQHNEKFEGWF